MHGRHSAFYGHINEKEVIPDVKDFVGKTIKMIEFNIIGAI